MNLPNVLKSSILLNLLNINGEDGGSRTHRLQINWRFIQCTVADSYIFAQKYPQTCDPEVFNWNLDKERFTSHLIQDGSGGYKSLSFFPIL